MSTLNRTSPLRNTCSSPSIVMINSVCQQVADTHNRVDELLWEHELTQSVAFELQRRLLDISANMELILQQYGEILGGGRRCRS